MCRFSHIYFEIICTYINLQVIMTISYLKIKLSSILQSENIGRKKKKNLKKYASVNLILSQIEFSEKRNYNYCLPSFSIF